MISTVELHVHSSASHLFIIFHEKKLMSLNFVRVQIWILSPFQYSSSWKSLDSILQDLSCQRTKTHPLTIVLFYYTNPNEVSLESSTEECNSEVLFAKNIEINSLKCNNTSCCSSRDNTSVVSTATVPAVASLPPTCPLWLLREQQFNQSNFRPFILGSIFLGMNNAENGGKTPYVR